MSTNQLRTAVATQKEPQSFPELLERMKPEIARALPKHLNAERMTRIALTEFRKAPKLGECNLRTVFGAIITLSQLGLEPGVLGQSYLIPYGKECQGIPGWQGLADLVSRAGRASVWTGAVFEGDLFDYAYGDRPFITHKPDESRDDAPGPDKMTHCYAVGRIKGAEWPIIEVWSKPKITKHRDRFNKVGAKHYSFQHFEMYGRKVALLQVIKYMPKSVELQTAVDLENAAQTGQTIDLAEAATGTWVPPGEPEADSSPAPTTAKTDPKEEHIPQHDAKTAIAAVRATQTLAELATVYEAIVLDFVNTNRQVPPEAESAYADWKAHLESKES
jgi:recombination protein RecT